MAPPLHRMFSMWASSGRPPPAGPLHHKRHVQPSAQPQAQQARSNLPVLLPPQEGEPRKTLVLDLDRTLIDCIVFRDPSISEPDFVYTDDLGTQAKVWTRPFLRQFLSAVARDFEVVLFTAAGARHADSVLQVIDPRRNIFSHRLYGQHTTEARQWGWVKDLSRLGRPPHSTLLVDDSQLAGLMQPCSLVPIRPFIHSNPKKDWDTALSELLRFLQDKVLPAADVRQAIALHWNKVTRRARRRPLQPYWQNGPSIPHELARSCSCSCHVAHHASLPPSSFLAAWAHDTRINALQPPAAVQQRHSAPHLFMQSPCAAPLAQGVQGTGVLVSSNSTPVPVAWHQCAAAQEGCGCNYSIDDHAVVAAAAAYDMRACHADEEEEEEDHIDSRSGGGGRRGCGCCSDVTGSGETQAKGMRRSPNNLHQLSSGGEARQGNTELDDAIDAALGLAEVNTAGRSGAFGVEHPCTPTQSSASGVGVGTLCNGETDACLSPSGPTDDGVWANGEGHPLECIEQQEGQLHGSTCLADAPLVQRTLECDTPLCADFKAKDPSFDLPSSGSEAACGEATVSELSADTLMQHQAVWQVTSLGSSSSSSLSEGCCSDGLHKVTGAWLVGDAAADDSLASGVQVAAAWVQQRHEGRVRAGRPSVDFAAPA